MVTHSVLTSCKRASGFIANMWVTLLFRRNSILAPIWTSFCFQIWNFRSQYSFHDYRNTIKTQVGGKAIEFQTCNRRLWTPLWTKKTTMPANIPSGSDGGLWFLVAFGASTWFVSDSSTVLHQDECFLRFYFYSQIMVLEAWGHFFQYFFLSLHVIFTEVKFPKRKIKNSSSNNQTYNTFFYQKNKKYYIFDPFYKLPMVNKMLSIQACMHLDHTKNWHNDISRFISW